jgi:hypothetical protein
MTDTVTERVTLEIPAATYDALHELLDRLKDAGREGDHGPLDLPKLAAMLLGDAAQIVTRSLSWEGSAMAELLEKHGYAP